jgi:hypothetical protein
MAAGSCSILVEEVAPHLPEFKAQSIASEPNISRGSTPFHQASQQKV